MNRLLLDERPTKAKAAPHNGAGRAGFACIRAIAGARRAPATVAPSSARGSRQYR
jgi:hypothetical protein